MRDPEPFQALAEPAALRWRRRRRSDRLHRRARHQADLGEILAQRAIRLQWQVMAFGHRERSLAWPRSEPEQHLGVIGHPLVDERNVDDHRLALSRAAVHLEEEAAPREALVRDLTGAVKKAAVIDEQRSLRHLEAADLVC